MNKSALIPFIFIPVIPFVVFDYLDDEKKPFTNSEMAEVYNTGAETGSRFTSTLYSLTNYEGTEIIQLPVSDHLIFVSNNEAESDSVFYQLEIDGVGVNIKKLGNCVRLCYQGRPFFQNGERSAHDSVIKFYLREETIDKYSFVFIHGLTGAYNFREGSVDLYVNGRILSQGILVNDKPTYLPLAVKKVDQNFIIKFRNLDQTSLYVLYNEKTGELILPEDYQTAKNDWDLFQEGIYDDE